MLAEPIMTTAKALMKDDDSYPLGVGYRYYHGLRTMRLAVEIIRQADLEVAVDQEALMIGALFHDLGKTRKADDGSGERHGPLGARLFRRHVLPKCVISNPELVMEIIEHHYHRQEPGFDFPLEVKAVQDGDLLDHFGCNGIWLSVGQALQEEGVCGPANERMGREREQALWRYAVAHMNFEPARLAVARRIAQQKSFSQRWQRQAEGALY